MSKQGSQEVQTAPTSPSSENGRRVSVMTREDISPEGAAVGPNQSKLRPPARLSDIQTQGDHGVADT